MDIRIYNQKSLNEKPKRAKTVVGANKVFPLCYKLKIRFDSDLSSLQ